MTGADDAAAAEAAQLEALRQGAERRRKELGDTLDALSRRAHQRDQRRGMARRGLRAARWAVPAVATARRTRRGR